VERVIGVNDASVAVLLIGAAIGVAEVALVSRSVWEYLCRVYRGRRRASRVAALIVGLVVPLMFGALMLVATVGVGVEDGISSVLARIGVLFLLLAGVHVLVLVVLARDRSQEQDIEFAEGQMAATRRRTGQLGLRKR
jgi:hypothetical protein